MLFCSPGAYVFPHVLSGVLNGFRIYAAIEVPGQQLPFCSLSKRLSRYLLNPHLSFHCANSSMFVRHKQPLAHRRQKALNT